jgi:hypothetical protein
MLIMVSGFGYIAYSELVIFRAKNLYIGINISYDFTQSRR